MCRLMVYLGQPCLLCDVVTKPNRSLITQSFDARERVTGNGCLNGDGFGVGWYPFSYEGSVLAPDLEETPGLFTSVKPAWNNENLRRLADKIVSPLIMAHVRAAYPGIPVTDQNCQPFTSGKYMFMHNGGIGGFHTVRRKLLETLRDVVFQQCPSFQSDSAVSFSMFMNELESPYHDYQPYELVEKIESVISKIIEIQNDGGCGKELSLLNFVVTDGRTVVATRYCNLPEEQPASLYYAAGSKFKCTNETTNDFSVVDYDRRPRMAIVASEPLTDNKHDWIPVPRNSIVAMTRLSPACPVNIIHIPIGASAKERDVLKRCISNLSRQQNCDQDAQLQPFRSSEDDLASHNRQLTDNCMTVSTKNRHVLTNRLGAMQSGIDRKGNGKASQKEESPILALAHSAGGLFAGRQDGTISVHSLKSFQCNHLIEGHKGSILALTIWREYLISACNRCKKRAHVGIIRSGAEFYLIKGGSSISNSTDIMSWRLKDFSKSSDLAFKAGKVYSLCMIQEGKLLVTGADRSLTCLGFSSEGVLSDGGTHVKSAHASMVLCSELGNRRKETVLCTGGGDSLISIWSTGALDKIGSLFGHCGAVNALAYAGKSNLYSAGQDGMIRHWDLDAMMCTRQMNGCDLGVLSLSLSLSGKTLLSAGADGVLATWVIDTFDAIQDFSLPTKVLSHVALFADDSIVGGGSDGLIHLWESPLKSNGNSLKFAGNGPEQSPGKSSEFMDMDNIEDVLRVLISHKSISGNSRFRRSCCKCAKAIAELLESMGANIRLISESEECNPVIVGRVDACSNTQGSVTIYGNYDILCRDADAKGWVSDPFQLTVIDGNFYGCGVSESKGPLVSVIQAVRELVIDGSLSVNVNFVIDGEQEQGSQGVPKALHLCRDWFQDTNVILCAGGARLERDQPCITYGMRGLICLEVSVQGPDGDLHSGQDGGLFNEPLNDLVRILSSLSNVDGTIRVPGFYDDVTLPDEREEQQLACMSYCLDTYKKGSGLQHIRPESGADLLRKRWLQPSCTINTVETSENGWSIIPKSAVAKISLRTVPHQDAHKVISAFTKHVEEEFENLQSPGNIVTVTVVHDKEWWISDPCDKFYACMARSVEKVWGRSPQFIRDGRTTPVIPQLQRSLNATAIHIPICQENDNSHRGNESLAREDIIRGKEVIKHFLMSWRNSGANCC